jgi:signal transduction histidine kinase
VLALGPRVRRTWEALAAEDVPFTLRDDAAGWLAVADGDQLDQVLWALLDNAVKYGGGTGVDVAIWPEPEPGQLRVTVADRGAGVSEEDRGRLFRRFERGGRERADEGSGLGLYVSRELCRAMDGDLILEPGADGRGAAFTIVLPGEAAGEE